MAVDTRNKRFSILNLLSPWRASLPLADSTIDAADRLQFEFLYSGIAAASSTQLTTLAHSPADILRYLLIDLGKGSNPTSGLSWPIYTSSEPTTPDNCITTYDRDGVTQGRIQYTGEVVTFHAVEVRIRATTHSVGWVKANALAVSIDRDILHETVTIEGSVYHVWSATRRGSVSNLGKESPISKRNVFSIPVIVSLYQLS